MHFPRPQHSQRLLVLTLPWLLSGCSSPTTPSATSSPSVSSVRTTSASSSSSLDAVRALPLFQQAERAYQKRQYQRAADLLSRLAASPELSANQRAFVQRQQEICLRPLQPNPPTPFPTSFAALTGKGEPLVAVSSPDCGPRALFLLCQKFGVKTSVEELKQAAGTTEKGTTLAGLAKAAKAVGLQAEGVQVSRKALSEIDLPAIAWVNENHFVVLLAVNGEDEPATVTIRDPNQAEEERLLREKFLRQSRGYLLLVRK